MGVLLELPRFLKFRWDLDDADFSRIWGFCTMLNVVLVVYVFTNNSGAGVDGMLQGNTAMNAANASVLTATRFMRWLPMTTFAFIAAQMFNVRPSVPLTGISLVLRWRRRKGDEAFTGRYLNVAFPYFMVCLFSAGIHTNAGTKLYFWGIATLMAWALWAVRPARFGWRAWLMAFLVVLGVGYSGMTGINLAQNALQNFNAQWMARFFGSRVDPLQTMTSMGRIGKLKLSPRIVIRLEPREVGHAPEYLREASYRNYQPLKLTWYAGGTGNDFELQQVEPDNTTWTLIPGKKTTDAATIACYLNGWSRELEAPEGLLPLPSGCSRLEKMPPNLATLKKNKNGAVLAAGLGLLIFDAHFGPGTTMDAPPDLLSTNRFDLTVPADEVPALEQVIAEMNLPADAGREQKLRATVNLFLGKFTYSTWQGVDKKPAPGETPLTKFLTSSRSGHCEYFATATVLLLRQMGIPARYAVGYYVHETRGTGYVVRERDAHAWCLVWNDAAKCWEDFDTTPPSWVAAESSPSRMSEWFSDARSWLKFQFAKFRWRQSGWQQYLFWALIPVLLVLLYHIIFRRRGKLRAPDSQGRHAAQILWPGLDSEFYRLEEKLAARGVPRQTGEPLADWLERALAAPALRELRGSLRELLRLHYRHRFDPRGLNEAEREELRRKAIEALQQIASSSSLIIEDEGRERGRGGFPLPPA
jgi:transglutaminase-like putative cysteine protease